VYRKNDITGVLLDATVCQHSIHTGQIETYFMECLKLAIASFIDCLSLLFCFSSLNQS